MSAGRRKPPAGLSLDADDLWSYLRTHGDPAWVRHPTYLDRFFPQALDCFDRLGVTLTFFVVGLDAARLEHADLFAEVTRRGHDVGNHTFEHECWLHRYTRAELDAELARAEDAIEAATGVRPTGFRGPGFSWSPTLLDVLAQRGYRYDASTLPTFLGPLARWYFLATSQLDGAERQKREALFGGVRDGFRPNVPYRWSLPGGRELLELPVTVMPWLRAPFHMSYLLYLARFSRAAMRGYLSAALSACRVAAVPPSFLLHPLDILGKDDVSELAFFPGMDLPGALKRELFEEVLERLRQDFEVLPLDRFAARFAEANDASGLAIRTVPVAHDTPLVRA